MSRLFSLSKLLTLLRSSYHHIRFNVYFPCLHGSGGSWWMTSKHFFLSLAKSMLTFLLSNYFWLPHAILSWVILWGNHHYPWRFYIYQTKHALPFSVHDHCSFLSWNHFLIVFSFSQVGSPSAEIRSSGLILHIQLTYLRHSSTVWPDLHL